MPLTSSGIAYDDTGDGTPTLLFLPGWCGPRTLFDPLCTRLQNRFRCLALDWRGHGESRDADGDFGSTELVEDAMAVIADSGTDQVMLVAAAHAGWIAIELRRRLGAALIPKLVLVDWMVLGAPPPFLDGLAAMAAPVTTRAAVGQLAAMWMDDLDLPDLAAYVASMTAYPDEMWARAAREIATAFQKDASPLDAIAALDPVPATLHVYAQPADASYLQAQQGFAAAHSWFGVERLNAKSHLPMFEDPDAMARGIEGFVAQ
ncbi:MAG: alpha/beta hydrolase [Pseudonocardiaceae bacterium]